MKVILIKGKAGSGKTTISALIKSNLQRLGISSIVSPNASLVKECAKSVYGWDNSKDPKGRQLLVDITATGYNYDPYFWERKNLSQVLTYCGKASLDNKPSPKVMIVDDWRYLSTYTYLKDKVKQVVTLEVVREDVVIYNSASITKSENGLDDFTCDVTINNVGSEQGLELLVSYLMPEILDKLEVKNA